jgi:hypothetical protein
VLKTNLDPLEFVQKAFLTERGLSEEILLAKRRELLYFQKKIMRKNELEKVKVENKTKNVK